MATCTHCPAVTSHSLYQGPLRTTLWLLSTMCLCGGPGLSLTPPNFVQVLNWMMGYMPGQVDPVVPFLEGLGLCLGEEMAGQPSLCSSFQGGAHLSSSNCKILLQNQSGWLDYVG